MERIMKHGILFVLLAFFSVSVTAQEKIEVTWYDATMLGIDGRGFADTNTPYDRLPAKAKKKCPKVSGNGV